MTEPYVNSSHAGASSVRTTTGEVYRPRPASTGLCGLRSCYRCGAFRLPADLVADRVPNMRRCGGGCTEGSKR